MMVIQYNTIRYNGVDLSKHDTIYSLDEAYFRASDR